MSFLPVRPFRQIAVALALIFAIASAAVPQTPTIDLELVIAVDVSFSMDEEEQRTQRAGYVEAFQNPSVIAAVLAGPLGRIAVTYVEWGGTSLQVVPWTVIDSPQSAARFAKTLSDQPLGRIPYTSISNSIAFARKLIRSSGFHGRRRVIDISGDGPNNYGAPAPVARNAAVLEGIVIDGLPIVLDKPTVAPTIPDIDAYYNHCVIGGEGAFFLTVKDVNQFGDAIRNKLITEISGIKLSLDPHPRFTLAQFEAKRRYNCFVGEELQEHPKRK